MVADVDHVGEDLEAGVAAGVRRLAVGGPGRLDLGRQRLGRRRPRRPRSGRRATASSRWPERKSKNVQPELVAWRRRRPRPRRRGVTRTQRPTPGWMWDPTTPSPSSVSSVASSPERRSSVAGASLGGRGWCQWTTMGSPFQRSAMSSFWMRSWSRTMPSSRASGRGGQPGMYTSTGMIWSQPLVTE